jgi:hypothetical protein
MTLLATLLPLVPKYIEAWSVGDKEKMEAIDAEAEAAAADWYAARTGVDARLAANNAKADKILNTP